MSSLSRQTRVMIRTNLASLPRRRAISLSMSLSIALVVCVLAGFLAMAKGFETALTGAGSPHVAVVLGGGARGEAGSDIPADAIRTLSAMTGDLGAVRNPDGTLQSSREIVTSVELKQPGDATSRTLALRGMDAAGPEIREGISLAAGRFFTPGTREIVVGQRLGEDFGLHQGDTVRLGGVDWTVAGRFSAHGSAFESEIWADIDAVRSARSVEGEVQSLRLRLSGEGGLERLSHALSTLPSASLIAITEADLVSAQAGRTSALIRLFGWPVALLMAVGATAGALNTMMSSVADRTVEIATVRALGFSRLAAFLGTWVEAVLLAAAGVVLGLFASFLAFNGWQASTMGANSARMAFQLAVTPDVMMVAGLLGLAIGVFGGALPAFAATRLPLTMALRARG